MAVAKGEGEVGSAVRGTGWERGRGRTPARLCGVVCRRGVGTAAAGAPAGPCAARRRHALYTAVLSERAVCHRAAALHGVRGRRGGRGTARRNAYCGCCRRALRPLHPATPGTSVGGNGSARAGLRAGGGACAGAAPVGTADAVYAVRCRAVADVASAERVGSRIGADGGRRVPAACSAAAGATRPASGARPRSGGGRAAARRRAGAVAGGGGAAHRAFIQRHSYPLALTGRLLHRRRLRGRAALVLNAKSLFCS